MILVRFLLEDLHNYLAAFWLFLFGKRFTGHYYLGQDPWCEVCFIFD